MKLKLSQWNNKKQNTLLSDGDLNDFEKVSKANPETCVQLRGKINKLYLNWLVNIKITRFKGLD